jgi:hypothetical protein
MERLLLLFRVWLVSVRFFQLPRRRTRGTRREERRPETSIVQAEVVLTNSIRLSGGSPRWSCRLSSSSAALKFALLQMSSLEEVPSEHQHEQAPHQHARIQLGPTQRRRTDAHRRPPAEAALTRPRSCTSTFRTSRLRSATERSADLSPEPPPPHPRPQPEPLLATRAKVSR